jgi:hypothetical protein
MFFSVFLQFRRALTNIFMCSKKPNTHISEEQGLIVFQTMSFVHNQTFPINAWQGSLVHVNQLIGCEKDMESKN